MEARIRELEKAAPREVIDVDATAENTMVVFSAIEELRKDTEEGWKKLAVTLDQVIEATTPPTLVSRSGTCSSHVRKTVWTGGCVPIGSRLMS